LKDADIVMTPFTGVVNVSLYRFFHQSDSARYLADFAKPVMKPFPFIRKNCPGTFTILPSLEIE
jgi:hypothetical protein